MDEDNPDTRELGAQADRRSRGGEVALPEIGAKVEGRYRIEAQLGAGAMGVVFAAMDEALGRAVALKCVRPEVVERSPITVARLHEEARAGAQVRHPNVVRIEAVASHEGLPVLVMEKVEGQTLEERLRRGPLPLPEAWDLLRAWLRGLSAIHAAGLVHRDLKPDNLFIVRDGDPKILDLGIAVDRMRERDCSTLGLTGEGIVIGTPAYMAPERARDPRRSEPQSDVYSMGAVLYRMLTGRPHFEGSGVQIFQRAFEEEPRSPAALRPGLPEEVARYVLRALAREREDRFEDARRMLERAEQIDPPEIEEEAASTRGREERRAHVQLLPGGNQRSPEEELEIALATTQISGVSRHLERRGGAGRRPRVPARIATRGGIRVCAHEAAAAASGREARARRERGRSRAPPTGLPTGPSSSRCWCS